MILFFNRRQVFLSQNMEQLVLARDLLAGANIPYICRVGGSTREAALRGRTGTLGLNQSQPHMLYVHKRDYGRAMACLLK